MSLAVLPVWWEENFGKRRKGEEAVEMTKINWHGKIIFKLTCMVFMGNVGFALCWWKRLNFFLSDFHRIVT
jgi:hypothetical protein